MLVTRHVVQAYELLKIDFQTGDVTATTITRLAVNPVVDRFNLRRRSFFGIFRNASVIAVENKQQSLSRNVTCHRDPLEVTVVYIEFPQDLHTLMDMDVSINIYMC